MPYFRFTNPAVAGDYDISRRSDCDSLDRLAADQRNTVAEYCPVCRGEPGRCLVEVMEEVVAATAAADKNDGEHLPI